jgi:hypothetical protein
MSKVQRDVSRLHESAYRVRLAQMIRRRDHIRVDNGATFFRWRIANCIKRFPCFYLSKVKFLVIGPSD